MSAPRVLAAGDRADDEERFCAGRDFFWERRVRRVVGEILLAGVEADEVAALAGGVVADGAAEHGVAGFQGVEDGAQRDGWGNVELDLAGDAGEGFQVVGDNDADHGAVGQTFLSAVNLRLIEIYVFDSRVSADRNTCPTRVGKGSP